MTTWALIQDENMGQQVVGAKAKGRLPGPALQPIRDQQPDKPMSELQHMMEDERRQHEDSFRYQYGHN